VEETPPKLSVGQVEDTEREVREVGAERELNQPRVVMTVERVVNKPYKEVVRMEGGREEEYKEPDGKEQEDEKHQI
jgi:hypothetical protein